MIESFEDFVTWMYVLVDDLWPQIAPLMKRPGPAPACSDSELITMALVGECREWDKETNLIAEWQNYRALFPHLPERSRFNRRRRNLMQGINLLRRMVLEVLDLAQDRQWLIDSLPVPVVQFHGVPQAADEWRDHEAAYGWVASKKQMIYGYKLHLVLTVGGLILDFQLAPANGDERVVAADLLSAYGGLTVLGDKGYVSAPLAEELRQQGIDLIAQRRQNQKAQLPADLRALLNHFRQTIETVNDQLEEQFHIETNHAHSFWGLCARLYTKLAAHTFCIYLNRLLGNPDWLQIKQLAFPPI
jgi:IS5 family transposase